MNDIQFLLMVFPFVHPIITLLVLGTLCWGIYHLWYAMQERWNPRYRVSIWFLPYIVFCLMILVGGW